MTNPYYHSAHWRSLRQQCLERDGYRCTADGCYKPGRIADHIETRPAVPYPCEYDVLSNLRTLCKTHDAQVKEENRRGGQRKQAGRFKVRGCDIEGWPHDRAHR
jgi:hypothetical protein